MRINRIILILIVGIAFLLSGCERETADTVTQVAETTSQPQSADVTADATAVTAAVTAESGTYTVSYNYKSEDTDADWNSASATSIAFDGDGADISGVGAEFADGTLTITRAGTFALSGNLADGQILIDADKDDVVRIVLNGVTVHNETAPAIYAPQCDKVVLIIADGTENTISDGENYSVSADDNAEAAIFVQDDLSITGKGQLTVIGNYNHGIRAQDDLVITGGDITVTAVNDALRGRDGVAISDGDITLIAGGDGIQSNNANSADVGFIIINGGTFDITAKNDGIQAQSSLTITDGTFNIKAGGGSANAPIRMGEMKIGGGGGWDGMWGRPTDITATEVDDAVEEVIAESMKALKAGNQVTIAGGDFTIDAEDDGVHSNGDVTITAGKLTIMTGDDGIHADNATDVSGGVIDIPVCYEGIEGLSVTVSGGDITVTANDDAINAAGGAVGEVQGGQRGMGMGMRGEDTFASAVDGDIFIRISGGNLTLYAPCDGLDSNGNIFIEGGSIKISGPSQGMEGAIDLDGTMLITGGEFITAGSVLNVSAESTQPSLLVSYKSQQPSGSVIEIKSADGETILEYTTAIAYTMSGFTSPSFAIGETYALYIDGEKRVDITLDGTVTSIGDDGSAYNAGMGGGRGNWGNQTGERMSEEGKMPQGEPFGNRPSGMN